MPFGSGQWSGSAGHEVVVFVVHFEVWPVVTGLVEEEQVPVWPEAALVQNL